jgi:hypothetical protein
LTTELVIKTLKPFTLKQVKHPLAPLATKKARLPKGFIAKQYRFIVQQLAVVTSAFGHGLIFTCKLN